MLTIETIECFYTYFYCHKYNESKFKLKRTKTTRKVCESFLKIIDKKYSLLSLGADFLWDYFLFQFNYWHSLTLENKFSNRTELSYIVGKKAFERWETRDTEYDWQIESYPIIKIYNVHKKDVFTKPEQIGKSEQLSRIDSSKAIRKQFLNTDQGFIMCIEYTTLFDPKDISCISCNNKKDCKELLRVNYPLLYNIRVKS